MKMDDDMDNDMDKPRGQFSLADLDDQTRRDVETTLYALIPQAKSGDVMAIEKLIALSDLQGNSRVIMPVLMMMNANIEKMLDMRSEEIDNFIIGFCIASIGANRGGRRELLSGIGGAPVSTYSIEETKERRGLLSRIFGR